MAVKELKLRDYPPIMESQMEKKMENEMETGGIWGLRNLIQVTILGKPDCLLYVCIHTHYGDLV